VAETSEKGDPMDQCLLFVINPGSTSTKAALFRGDDCLFERSVKHAAADLQQPGGIIGQLPVRLAAVRTILAEALAVSSIEAGAITAFVGRGGLVHSVPGGVYAVNEQMLSDLRDARYGEHACNLGALIAQQLASEYGRAAYIADPPPVDEMIELARYSGTPQFRRKSVFHALNQKAIARRAAAELGKPYERCRLVVAHMGGGISVGAHLNGRVIDVNNAMEEGPFSPDRSGTVPSLQLLDLCFSGRYGRQDIYRMLVGQGGLFAYTGSTDCRMIEEEAANHPEYRELLQAMAYQVAKAIGAMAAALGTLPDAVVLTGGLAHSAWLVGEISSRVSFLGPVLTYPGEDELAALATAVCRVLRGEDVCHDYR
jgi:butyrate kinase